MQLSLTSCAYTFVAREHFHTNLKFCVTQQYNLKFCATLQYNVEFCAILQYNVEFCATLQYNLEFCAILQYNLEFCCYSTVPALTHNYYIHAKPIGIMLHLGINMQITNDI